MRIIIPAIPLFTDAVSRGFQQGLGKRWTILDSGQLIGIIVGIVVVLAIVAVAVLFGRRRKMAEDRNRAVDMRE